MVHSFEVSASEAREAAVIADKLVAALSGGGSARVRLAAIVETLRRLEASDEAHEAAA